MSDKAKPGLTRRQLLTLGGVATAGSLVGTIATRQADAEGLTRDDTLPQVPRRTLGKTGQKIPILLMGGANGFDPRFDPKLAEALRFGVNYIDAADCYAGGACEPAIGSFHKRAKARADLWITSKSDAHDPAGFERTVHASLERLQTDFIDMYFLHALRDPGYINDKLRQVVDKLKQQKKIRYFGFSAHNANVPELLQLAARTPWIDAVMFRYNFRQYGDARLNAAMDAAHAAKVGLIAMKTQASEVGFEDAWKKFEKTGKWSKHQAVLKAVWADPRITAAVSGMDTFEKLRANIAAALDRSELTRGEWDALDRYARATRSLACDGCDHICREALDKDIPIGDTLRFLMYHDVYGERDKARDLFAKQAVARADIERTDFRAANAACPHGVDIAERMQRALKVLC